MPPRFLDSISPYCEQDAALFRNKNLELEELLTYKTTYKAVLLIQEHIQAFLKRYNRHGDKLILYL